MDADKYIAVRERFSTSDRLVISIQNTVNRFSSECHLWKDWKENGEDV